MDKQTNDSLIDWYFVIQKLWKDKVKLLIVCLICALFGFAVALITPNKFSSSTVFIPTSSNTSTDGLGDFGGLASLAGVNLNSGDNSSGIPPALYPKLVKSVRFKRQLINSKFYLHELEDSITYSDYYTDHHKRPVLKRKLESFLRGLLGLIPGSNKSKKVSSFGDEIFILSEEEENIFKLLDKQLSILPNKKDGFVELVMETENPSIAAQTLMSVREILKEELTKIKINNASEQLEFTLLQFNEKQQEFLKAQQELALFQDKNQNISTATARSQERQLEAEYNLKLSIYNELSQQLEKAKLQVKKESPSFSILQDITVPIEKSSPNRFLIIFMSFVLGVVFYVACVVISLVFKNLKQVIETENG